MLQLRVRRPVKSFGLAIVIPWSAQGHTAFASGKRTTNSLPSLCESLRWAHGVAPLAEPYEHEEHQAKEYHCQCHPDNSLLLL